MILRLSSNAQRAVVVAASFSVALVLAYFSIRNALAAHYVGLQTGQSCERAVHLEPTEPQDWYLLGRYWQYNLEDPDATGAIHSDLEKHFIRAEVTSFADYVAGNGEQGAKEAGKLRLEGKDYVVRDGDVMHFRFNV